MNRRTLAVAVAGAVALALAWATFAALSSGGRDDDVPTARVERRDFVRRVEADGTLAAVRATPLTVPRELRGGARIAWLAENGARIEAGEPVVRFDLTDMEDALVAAEEDLTVADVRLEKERTAIAGDLAGLERDAELARRELETAERFQKRDEEIYSRIDIIESEIDGELAAERHRHAVAARGTRERMGQTDVELIAIERRTARQSIEQAERGLQAVELTAPHPGLVVFATDWRGNPLRVGDSVFPGQLLAQLPELSEMQAEVWVLEADAGGLAPGLEAEVRVEAHPHRLHRAEVERVDTLAKPRLRGSPVQYFAATLRFAEQDPGAMKPGQRVRALLRVEERPDALVVPRQAVHARGAGHVVFRRRGGSFRPVPVELGPLTPALAVVESGVEAGDEVALVDLERRGMERGDPGDGGDGATAGSGGPLGAGLP